jgi:hypothetical protein
MGLASAARQALGLTTLVKLVQKVARDETDPKLKAAVQTCPESWLRKIGQRHEWIFCLTAARILAANQERR